MITNLLSNAVKYSPEGARLRFGLFGSRVEGGDSQWAVLQVQDWGIGIPANDLPNIFERFYGPVMFVGDSLEPGSAWQEQAASLRRMEVS